MDLIMHSHLGKSAPNVFHEPSFSDLERGACDRTTAKNDLDTIPGCFLRATQRKQHRAHANIIHMHREGPEKFFLPSRR